MSLNLPFSQQEFLQTYWQRKPVYIAGGCPNPESLLDKETLVELALETNVEARMVHCSKNAPWELTTSPLSAEELVPRPDTPWTLLVQAVDHWIPEVLRFRRQFYFLPEWRLEDIMVSLSSEGAGVGPHYDQYDVFLVQLSGSRTWHVGPKYDDSHPSQLSAGLKQLTDMETEQTWDTLPGDIIYLPPGQSHNGIATSDDCITLSVGFRAPAHADILLEMFGDMATGCSDSLRFSDAKRAKRPTWEISEEDISKVQQIALHYVNDRSAIQQWFGCYMTMPKYPELMPDHNYSDLQPWITAIKEPGTRIIREPASRRAADTQYLYLDGRAYSRSEISVPLVQVLLSDEEITPAALLSFTRGTEPDQQLLLNLFNNGYMYPE